MAPRTLTRESLNFDLSKLDLSKLDISKLDLAKLNEKLGFDLPKFDRSRLESFDFSENVAAFEKAVGARLDELEGRLPEPATRLFQLQREALENSYAFTKNATESLVEATSSVFDQAKTSADKAVKNLRDQTETTLPTADSAPDNAVIDYSTLTKGELYQRAQELDIAGRSSMSKTDLVKAIKNH